MYHTQTPTQASQEPADAATATRYCPDCDEFRPLKYFYKDRFRPDGLTTYCKTHHQARKDERRVINEIRAKNGAPPLEKLARKKPAPVVSEGPKRLTPDEKLAARLVVAGFWDRDEAEPRPVRVLVESGRRVA